MGARNLFNKAVRAASQKKTLILFFALAHIVFLFFGQWMVAQKYPGVLSLRAEQLREIQELPYLKPLTGILAGSLVLKILYTFFFNLIFGALLSTTLTGFIFFFPYFIAVWRSFLIGMLIYGVDINPAMAVVFYGTFILEFGAYCMSSAIGTDLGLSLIWPGRKGTGSRKAALAASVREGSHLYVLIIIVLFIAAVWEITWLHYLGPIIKPEEILG